MNLLRLVRTLLALPGRVLIRGIDDLKRSNGVPPLGRFLRGCVHVFVWFVGFSMVVSAVNPPPAPATRSVVSSAPTSTRAPAETASHERLTGAGVMSVTDGDTFVVAIDGELQSVRVLGIDSCESDTPGGALATAKARELLVGSVGLRAEPGVDKDRYGRLLRYVQTSSGDFGQLMVGYDHTGVYQGKNDASDAYIERLYAHDRDHSEIPPPSGRECGSSPAVDGAGDGPDYVPLPDDDDDGESRFCRKRWWC